MATMVHEVPSPRIGPNAITRVAEVLVERFGAPRMAAIFGRAGLAQYLDALPTQMVDEAEVIRLHAELRATLDAAAARDVAREAGRRTGDYLLAHRIPRPVQWLLDAPAAARWLPACCSPRSRVMPGPSPAAAGSRCSGTRRYECRSPATRLRAPCTRTSRSATTTPRPSSGSSARWSVATRRSLKPAAKQPARPRAYSKCAGRTLRTERARRRFPPKNIGPWRSDSRRERSTTGARRSRHA